MANVDISCLTKVVTGRPIIELLGTKEVYIEKDGVLKQLKGAIYDGGKIIMNFED